MTKPVKIIRHKTEGDAVEYMGIGHSGGNVSVWAHYDYALHTWSDAQTHDDMFGTLGKDKIDFWRGRFEGFTKKVSVVPPRGKRTCVPKALRISLEKRFGRGLELHLFKPQER